MKHGYSKGLNKDMSPMKTDPNSLHHAVNIHLRTDDGDSSLAVINGKGNKQLTIADAELYDRTGYSIINVKTVREDMVVFWAQDSNSGFGIIDKLVKQEDESYVRVQLYASSDVDSNLEFYPNQPLALALNYRNQNDIKLYVTGENYIFRVFDISPKYETSPLLESSYKLADKLANSFLRIPHVKFATPAFETYAPGGLFEGIYQYAYRLVTKNDIATVISPASLRIPVTSSINASHTSKLFGSVTGGSENSGIGIKVKLDLSNISIDEFEYAEIFSLYYSDSTQIPTINIIEQIPVTSDAVSFIDETNEAKYGTITYDEFVSVLSDFSASHLAIKDDRLFAANIKNSAFDVAFDARAYRSDDLGVATIVNNGVTYPITKIGVWPNAEYKVDLGAGLVDIPEDFDCINPANQNDLATATVTQQYDTSGEIFGGEGSNVRYEIGSNVGNTYFGSEGAAFYNSLQKPTLLEDQLGTTIPTNAPKTREYILGMTKSFKTGETYRFGVVFFSDLGIASPVKWIGDIIISDTMLGSIGPKFIKFTVNTANSDAYSLNFQIVYEPLTSDTRRVVSEGIADTFAYLNNARYTPNCIAYSFRQLGIIETKTVANDYFAFSLASDQAEAAFTGLESIEGAFTLLSPEGALGTITQKSGLKVRRISTLTHNTAQVVGDFKLPDPGSAFFSPASFMSTANYSIEDYFNDSSLQELMQQHNEIDVEDVVNLNYDSSGEALLINGVSKLAYAEGGPYYIAGNQLVLSTSQADYPSIFDGLQEIYNSYSDNSPYTTSIGTPYVPEAYLITRLYKLTTPYLGEDYTSRLNSVYVPASEVSSNATTLWANKGDVTVSRMDALKTTVAPQNWGTPNSEFLKLRNIYFTVESTINCYMQHDASLNRGGYSLYDDNEIRGYLQTKGSATGDLYKYNALHSQPDNSRLFIPVDEDFQKNTIRDTQIRWSEADIDVDGIDNMSVFKPNNYKNANNNYGPINALTNWKDNLFIHQNEGFASLGVNSRATQVASDGSTIILGQGEVLDKVQYLSTNIGNQKGSQIVTSPSAFYWLDRFKSKLYRFNGNINTISDTSGLSGFFRKATNDKSLLVGGYLPDANSVYLSIKDVEVTEEEVTEVTEVIYDREVVTVVEETVESYTKASALITINAVTIDSWVQLTLDGVTVQFTCVNTITNPLLEFTEGVDNEATTANLSITINLYLASEGLTQVYTTEVLNNELTINAVNAGLGYDTSPDVFNAILAQATAGEGSGNAGYELLASETTVLDDSWVIVDISPATVVDRLSITKNGVTVAQTGVYQGSNEGYPDVIANPPQVINDSGVVLKDIYKGVWDVGTLYGLYDLVSIGTDVYLCVVSNTGDDPTISPSWVLQPVVGTFDTSDWVTDPVYENYLVRQAYIGIGSNLINYGQPTGYFPTRYDDYLAAGGLKSPAWLGNEGDSVYGGIIKDGVISHYQEAANFRGQRLWTKVDAGDTYTVEAMGVGNTAYKYSFFEITPTLSDISVIGFPTELVSTTVLTETTTVVSVPVDVERSYIAREVTVSDNRYGVLSLVSGTHYRISSLASPFVFSENVEYEIAGGVFTVSNIDYDSNYVDFELVGGTPVLGQVDMEEFIIYPTPFTLSFDEQLNVFSSFWSFMPNLYVSSDRDLITTMDNATLYSHNSEVYNSFYGTIYDSYFDIVVSNSSPVEMLNIEAYVDVQRDGEYLADKGIYSIKAWTNGQESDEVVLYPKDTVRLLKDSEGTRLPNQGITTGIYPYSTLYNASKNADKVWRFQVPRIREDLVVDAETMNYRNRTLGASARLRFKLRAEGDETRFVVEDVNIIGEQVKL